MIFYDNVDLSLVEYIKHCIPSCTNVLMYNPKVDNTNMEFPCVTVLQTGETFNKNLKNFNNKIHEDLNNGTIKITKAPDMLSIEYQIDIWSNSRRDLNYLVREWLTKNPFENGVLPVRDDFDTTYIANFKRKGFRNLNSLQDAQNIFRYSYIYVITVPLPSESKIRYRVRNITPIINNKQEG